MLLSSLPLSHIDITSMPMILPSSLSFPKNIMSLINSLMSHFYPFDFGIPFPLSFKAWLSSYQDSDPIFVLTNHLANIKFWLRVLNSTKISLQKGLDVYVFIICLVVDEEWRQLRFSWYLRDPYLVFTKNSTCFNILCVNIHQSLSFVWVLSFKAGKSKLAISEFFFLFRITTLPIHLLHRKMYFL